MQHMGRMSTSERDIYRHVKDDRLCTWIIQLQSNPLATGELHLAQKQYSADLAFERPLRNLIASRMEALHAAAEQRGRVVRALPVFWRLLSPG